MNPFQLQAEMLRQWLDLTGAMATAAMAAWRDIGQQSVSAWSKGGVPVYPAASAGPMPGWPPFGMMGANAFTPWMNVLGSQSPLMNAFGTQSSFPMWPQLPSPWTAMMFGQASPFSPFTMASPAALSALMPWAWPSLAAPSPGPWWSTGRLFAPPPETLFEQIATNYRTASGYAAATVLGPFGTALEPRIFGQPWWQVSQKRNLH